ncbi:hypothetical protein LMG3441_00798 [Achromobacter kerstersii]|uniref:Uncharacterized protein n=1 Tax=Achromobacter kerstersii TaxID=1353890 RepID=A0A6S7ADJ0_9BURK|nr:hypothetical protein LMG3441_00798 [Achromobacter kerstersii]
MAGLNTLMKVLTHLNFGALIALALWLVALHAGGTL